MVIDLGLVTCSRAMCLMWFSDLSFFPIPSRAGTPADVEQRAAAAVRVFNNQFSNSESDDTGIVLWERKEKKITPYKPTYWPAEELRLQLRVFFYKISACRASEIPSCTINMQNLNVCGVRAFLQADVSLGTYNQAKHVIFHQRCGKGASNANASCNCQRRNDSGLFLND